MIELDVVICASFLHCKVLNVNMSSAQCWMVLIDNCCGGFIVDVEASGTRFRETKIAEDHV